MPELLLKNKRNSSCRSTLSLLVFFSTSSRLYATYCTNRALAKSGKSVLHLDRNEHYGEDTASFSFTKLLDWAKAHSRGDDVRENGSTQSTRDETSTKHATNRGSHPSIDARPDVACGPNVDLASVGMTIARAHARHELKNENKRKEDDDDKPSAGGGASEQESNGEGVVGNTVLVGAGDGEKALSTVSSAAVEAAATRGTGAGTGAGAVTQGSNTSGMCKKDFYCAAESGVPGLVSEKHSDDVNQTDPPLRAIPKTGREAEEGEREEVMSLTTSSLLSVTGKDTEEKEEGSTGEKSGGVVTNANDSSEGSRHNSRSKDSDDIKGNKIDTNNNSNDDPLDRDHHPDTAQPPPTSSATMSADRDDADNKNDGVEQEQKQKEQGEQDKEQKEREKEQKEQEKEQKKKQQQLREEEEETKAVEETATARLKTLDLDLLPLRYHGCCTRAGKPSDACVRERAAQKAAEDAAEAAGRFTRQRPPSHPAWLGRGVATKESQEVGGEEVGVQGTEETMHPSFWGFRTERGPGVADLVRLSRSFNLDLTSQVRFDDEGLETCV